MPAKGSSSSMNEGSLARARAISTRRRSPPDSEIAGAARRCSMRSSCSSSVTVVLARAWLRSRSSTTAMTFSSTVMPRKIEVSCGR